MIALWLQEPAVAADLLVGPTQTYATIGEAVAAAASGDRVLVDPGVYVEGSIRVDLATALEIRAANGPGTVTVRGTVGQQLLEVRGGALVLIADLEVDGEGTRQLASVSGASTLQVVGCDVHDTDAGNPSHSGGAIEAVASTVEVTGSTFGASASARDGGFFDLDACDTVLRGSTFTQGQAGRNGGAVSMSGGTLLVDASTFDGGTADDGAALWIDGGALTSTGSVFVGQAAGGSGAVFCSAGATCDLVDATFDGNTAPAGAALWVDASIATVTRATVCRSGGGSAMTFGAGAAATLVNTVLLGNDTEGASVIVETGASVQVVNNTFVASVSTVPGTAIRVDGGDATLVNNLVAWNDGPAAAVSAFAGATVGGGYQGYWQNQVIDTDRSLPNELTGADPLFPEPPAGACDPFLVAPPATSPLVDRGDPAILDADGSRSDIGAFGGAAALDPVDGDGDGWYSGNDCDDAAPAVHPGQAEVPCNALDDDCDAGTLDDADADADGVTTCAGDCDDADPTASTLGPRFTDADGDGVGVGDPVTSCGEPPGTAPIAGDCDDADPGAFPGAPETPYDGIDQDCDGVDLDDLDGDGALGVDDCDDLDPERSDLFEDVPDDGIDQDCTGADASATLNGGAGLRCGCAAGPPGGRLPGLVVMLGWVARRSRRQSRTASSTRRLR